MFILKASIFSWLSSLWSVIQDNKLKSHAPHKKPVREFFIDSSRMFLDVISLVIFYTHIFFLFYPSFNYFISISIHWESAMDIGKFLLSSSSHVLVKYTCVISTYHNFCFPRLCTLGLVEAGPREKYSERTECPIEESNKNSLHSNRNSKIS